MLIVAFAVLACLVATLGAASSASPTARPTTTSGGMTPAVGGSPKFQQAAFLPAVSRNPGVVFRCQLPTAATKCYGPAQIRTAYNVNAVHLFGKGTTIAIIDAYKSPTIRADLAAFNKVFGLPQPTFNIFNPFGASFDPNDDNQVGWAAEAALDVQWAHAIAPLAKIDLVLAKTNQDADILAALRYVVQHNLGDVLSQSYGEDEHCMAADLQRQEHALFRQASLQGMSLFASSGDTGAAEVNCAGTALVKVASDPAVDPYVTGVGGTSLKADLVTGAYISETAVNDGIVWSGGGYSTIYPRPIYQIGATGRHAGRGVPDVAYNAGVKGGVVVACAACNGGQPAFYIIGGTSAGSPQWAAIAALGVQRAGHRLGLLNPALYLLAHVAKSDFHDITTGNNSIDDINGYQAGPGWDPVTGLGTPDAAKLLSILH